MKTGSPTDRRAVRTRQKLLQAFTELVLTRGYAAISPADVAIRAGVGRSTLYTHFPGLLQMLEASLDRPCRVLADSVRVSGSARDLATLLRHFRTQSVHNAVFFRDPVSSLWAKCLARAILASLRADPDRARHRPAIPRQMLGGVLAELQLAIIRQWLADPAATSAEVVAATLMASTQRLLLGR